MSGNQVPDEAAPPAPPPDPATPVGEAGETTVDGSAQAPKSDESPSKTNLSVSRIEQRLVDAGLDGVDTHTDAQLEQAGRILADEFGIKTIPGRNIELGSALLTLRRAVKHAFASND